MKKNTTLKHKNGYVGFVRVSTEEQAKDGVSLDVQAASVRKLAQQLGGDMLKVWSVSESAYKADKRTHFMEMLAYARENRDKIRGIIFPSVDRAMRNPKDLIALQELQAETGIKILFADNPHADFDSASGELQIALLANFARFRSRHDAEKIKNSLQRVRETEGRVPGHAPYGYRNERVDRKPVTLPHVANAAVVRKIFDLFATGGFSLESLSEYLVKQGIRYAPSRAAFGRQLLQKILRNRFYIGEIKSKDEWYPGGHEPIVPASVFMQVQKQLGNRRQQAHDHPYGGGLLKCAHCGAAVVGELIRGKYRYYRCDTKGHPKTRTNADALDEQIAKALAKLRLDDGEVAETFKDVMRKGLAEAEKSRQKQTREYQKRLADADARRLKIVELRLDTSAKVDPTDWQALYDRAGAECKAIRLELEALEQEGDTNADLAIKTLELSQHIAIKWLTFDWRAKRRLLDILWLNCYWNGVTLAPTWNKPFDLLAEGLMLNNGAEERT